MINLMAPRSRKKQKRSDTKRKRDQLKDSKIIRKEPRNSLTALVKEAVAKVLDQHFTTEASCAKAAESPKV